jgi:CRISPR/Cas system CSM-associated protein Csm3 (group 7 of RAMP superfamily)
MRTTLITVRLEMTAPGGVAGPERARPVEPSAQDSTNGIRNNLPLRLDPAGDVHLPGTSVAGSLRAHCTDNGFPAELFGLSDPKGRPRASAIQVLGVHLHANATETLWTTRVAIDRHRGAPQVSALFSTQQLPAGTTFDVYLRWDDPSDELSQFRALLQSWSPRLGRGITTGAGACIVNALSQRDYDLSTADDLAAWLAETAIDDYPQPDSPVNPPDRVADVVDVELAIVDGLHLGSGALTPEPGREGKVTRILRDPDGRPRIPGSNLKGVLRSRAEYICRVLGLDSCPDGAVGSCGACLPCEIFGWSPRTGDDRIGARGSVVVHDTVIEYDGEPVEFRPHVALDRVTGGQRSSLLYTDEVAVAGRFRLRVEPLRPPTAAESALLNAVVTDLHEGLVGIGAATTRGHGTVRVTDGRWQPPDLSTLAEVLGAVHV